MGAACSQVEPPKNRASLSKRVSFSTFKKSQSNSLLKAGSDYLTGYSTIGTSKNDDKVAYVQNKDNEIEYVARAIEQSQLPLKDVRAIGDYLGVLAGLDHPHICRFIEAFDCNDIHQLIYEKAGPETIFEVEPEIKKGKPIKEELGQIYCRQIAMGLAVAHRQGIVHGRLRETSLLLDPVPPQEGEDRCLKICDIGQTFICRPPRGGQGKCHYEAPESLWGELPAVTSIEFFQSQSKQYAACDCWSLGVILYRMLTGKLPFDGSSSEVMDKIKSSVVTFGKEWESMPDARDVVHGLLKHNPRIRMTADKVLRHPWIMLSRQRVSKSKMMRVLQNVLFNTQESTFKKFAMRVIAEDVNPEKIEIATKAFRYIDKNCDGTLEVKEVRGILKKYQQEEASADEIFDAIDRDASGTLNFAEFCAMSIGPAEYTDRETLWHTFNRFDKDKNGSFDRDEITAMVREVESLNEQSAVETEVEEIAKDILIPMDFDTFVHIMLTPSAVPVNTLKCNLDRLCYSVLRVDNHHVRHITPKTRETGAAANNPLMKSPYRRSTMAAGGMRSSLKANA